MRAVTSLAVVVVVAVAGVTGIGAQGSSCDRACLGDVMTRYLSSLVAPLAVCLLSLVLFVASGGATLG